MASRGHNAKRCCASLVLIFVAHASAQTRPADSPPSPDELRQMFDALNTRTSSVTS